MTSELEHCLAILKALQIDEVSYCLSGGGDSGTVEINHVLYADGRHGPLPTVTIDITDAGGIVSLDERLENIVYELPDGDWINNEGGYGNVVLRPQETDPDCQVECDMTYGEDSERAGFRGRGRGISLRFRWRRSGPPGEIVVDRQRPSTREWRRANDHLRLDHRHRRMLHAPRRPRKSPAPGRAPSGPPGHRRSFADRRTPHPACANAGQHHPGT